MASPSSADSAPILSLHTWCKSSCAARLRIALAYKGIPYQPVYVNFPANEHRTDEYAKINPSRSVPTLAIQQPGSQEPPQYITQSVAAIEWLEETYPGTPALLPATAMDRARVRALVEIVAGEVQPRTNNLIRELLTARGVDATEWGREFHVRGFDAYERLIRTSAGRFSVGDAVSIADVCLVPAVWNALNYGISLDDYPTLARVYGNLMEVPAFPGAHWKKQPDCPEAEK